MGTYRTETVRKTCNVVDPDTGKVLGTVVVEEVLYWHKPDQGDGYAPHEIDANKQLSNEYRVYTQIMHGELLLEGPEIDNYKVSR